MCLIESRREPPGYIDPPPRHASWYHAGPTGPAGRIHYHSHSHRASRESFARMPRSSVTSYRSSYRERSPARLEYHHHGGHHAGYSTSQPSFEERRRSSVKVVR